MYEQYQEVWNALTADGADFEIAVEDIRGNPTRTYKNAPGNLRDVWASSIQFGDAELGDQFGLTKSQLMAIVDEYIDRNLGKILRLLDSMPAEIQQKIAVLENEDL